MKHTSKTIALIVAMQAEADPVIEALDLTEQTAKAEPQPRTPLAHRRFETQRGSVKIVLQTNGVDPVHGVDAIGTAPAIVNTLQVISSERPALVISAGTAGGYERSGTSIGDLVLADRSIGYHDHRIELPGFDVLGRAHATPVDLRALAERCGFLSGPITTGDSLDESEPDQAEILRTGALAKDMEAAAVAWVCERMATPVTALKAITDLVDHPAPTGEQFTENLSTATAELARGVVALLDGLDSVPPI